MSKLNLPGSARPLVIVCVTFFAAGMASAAIGPLIPDLARQTRASEIAVGGMLSALFAGALASQIACGALLRPGGERRVMLAGMVACLIGAAAIATSSSLVTLLAATALLGLGFGGVTVAGNVLAAAAAASDGAGPLNLVNAMFGLGAILSPALVGLCHVLSGSGVAAFWAIPCAMALGMALLLFWAPAPARGYAPPPAATTGGAKGLARSPLMWILCGFAFAYVSVENGISGWLPTILDRGTGLPAAVGALAASWFWLLMTLARFGAAWASRRTSPLLILRGCVGLCIAGIGLLIAAALFRSQILGFAAAALLGSSLGPILPTTLALVLVAFPAHSGTATGLIFAIGSVGGAIVPWAIGALIVERGPVAGTAALLALPIAMALLLAAIDRQLNGARPSSRARTPQTK